MFEEQKAMPKQELGEAATKPSSGSAEMTRRVQDREAQRDALLEHLRAAGAEVIGDDVLTQPDEVYAEVHARPETGGQRTPKQMTIEPLGLHYVPNLFPAGKADSLFEELLKLPWHQHVYRMYGKPVPAPRHYVWMGGDGYQSPRTVGDVFVHPWTPEALAVKERVEAITRAPFNSCNVNLYRDHNQYIGWHADGEKEGSWDFPIASVSFGSSRDFQVRKGKHGEIHTIPLEHGSLVVMPAGFQREWLHKVRKSSQVCGPRVNLTFRHQIVEDQGNALAARASSVTPGSGISQERG